MNYTEKGSKIYLFSIVLVARNTWHNIIQCTDRLYHR